MDTVFFLIFTNSPILPNKICVVRIQKKYCTKQLFCACSFSSPGMKLYNLFYRILTNFKNVTQGLAKLWLFLLYLQCLKSLLGYKIANEGNTVF